MPPTVDNRLQRLEDKVADLEDMISGNGKTSWDRSVRGRVHYLLGQEAARQQLLTAGSRKFTRHEKLAGLGIAVFALGIQVTSLVLIALGGHG
jgi:hypothetical protein